MDTGYQTFTFVGRKEEIRTFNEHLTQYKLIGLFGLRAVGKSCFIHEVLKLKEEYHQILNLKTVQHVEDIYSIICASLHSQPFPLSSERSWIVHLIDLINNLSDCVLVFDNAENVIEGHHCDTFLYLCSELTQQCDHTKVVITSTTRVDFPSLRTSYFVHELKPLSHDDSKTLFNAVAPTVSLAMFENAILDLSEGLPLLIIVIAGALEQEKDLITVEDMVELLLESRLETLCTESGTGSLHVGRLRERTAGRQNMLVLNGFVTRGQLLKALTVAKVNFLLG
ncbi:hypothetical protein DPMN_085476 [Dreissena polymorpha]|uniref:Uncharacterized protein n=1 Tax=Dreissena polymorpha TaxID=45954 RepID=A0A9D3YCH2_DREPO|nr:hypothetical protein DPMN_085476 [Dreissena polymorpha]